MGHLCLYISISGAMFFYLAVAVISVHGQTCTLGRTDLQPSVPNPNPGLFIQEQGRAPCDGQIIGWTVCYYDPRTFSCRETFQISLEVWRSATLRHLNIVGSNSVRVELPNEVEDFQCVNITVDPAERINVQQGDFLGVYASAFAVLPVVSTNAGSGRVLFFQVTATPPGSVFIFGSGQPLATQFANHAVHVTATIGKYIYGQVKKFFLYKAKFNTSINNVMKCCLPS